ncbi:MAG: MBL fold metallo-hydrolase [Gammaproteobacteria bacterium]|nr:MAG: MBL fold metallo-hydrolase [Gammaproteobacteria bacterium]
MRFASIGSGSRGNATLISHKDTTLLVDCGFSARETEKRLQRLSFDASKLSAILVTHEHADHINGVRVLARKHNLPVYATAGTAAHLAADVMGLVTEFSSHEAFSVGDIEIQPFPVPHDAREPSQFVFHDGQHKLGLLTDVGSITPVIEEHLTGCDALLLEANHDRDMLDQGEYPEHLKYRVSGRLGHLNNVQSAKLLEKIDTSRLQHIVAMHLSEKNNSPNIVRPLFAQALDCDQSWIAIAEQDTGFDWRELNNG